MFLAAIIFEDIYLNIVTITFSALILTEFLNIYSEVLQIIIIHYKLYWKYIYLAE